MHYHRKVIISGEYVELYEYEKVLWRNFKRVKKEKTLQQKSEEQQKKSKTQTEKRKDSISRTRTKIRRLVQSNTDLTKFVTLTFADNITDITLANRHFNKFIMRINYQYKNLKYVCVIEFQKRGAVHYHFLCNLPYVKTKTLEKIWGHGFVKINRIKHVDNVGAYVCKYLNKDADDRRLFRRKKFFHSENLENPIEIYDDETITGIVSYYGLDVLKPTYTATFSNEYTGEVSYQSFKVQAKLLEIIQKLR